MNTNYQKYLELRRKITDINLAAAVLHWDQEVHLPPKGAQHRAQQLSTLAGVAHEIKTSVEYGDVLKALRDENDLTNKEKRNAEISWETYEKTLKYSTEFVMKLSEITSKTYHAWIEARKNDDFKSYAAVLAEMVELKRQEADIRGFEDHAYDAHLDMFEKGSTSAEVETVFNQVKPPLIELIETVSNQPQVDDSFLQAHYNKDKQWDFGIDLLKQMGYDFDAGRQDISAHPFTINFSPNDVRVTTRVNENDFREMTWSCIHEGGHALYEQGLNADDYGTPCGEAISLGIHESQSRLWENHVARNLNYWKKNYPTLQEIFPENLSSVSVESFYNAINKVNPSLIRVEADELTYHLHIIIRFEIEKGLMEGIYEVANLNEIWNAKYKQYMGVDVPNDAKGVLQDIHWSHGSFGYFPTYSLGSMYAAQFYNQASLEIPGLEDQIAQGELLTLKSWLNEKVHRHGQFYSANQLCENLTGEKLNPQHFLKYAAEKFGAIYNVALEPQQI